MARKSSPRKANARRQADFVARQSARGLMRVRYWLTADERKAVERYIERLRGKRRRGHTP